MITDSKSEARLQGVPGRLSSRVMVLAPTDFALRKGKKLSECKYDPALRETLLEAH